MQLSWLRICFKIPNLLRPTRKTKEAQATNSTSTPQRSTMDSSSTPRRRVLPPMTRTKFHSRDWTNLLRMSRLWIVCKMGATRTPSSSLTKIFSKNSMSPKSKASSRTLTSKKYETLTRFFSKGSPACLSSPRTVWGRDKIPMKI